MKTLDLLVQAKALISDEEKWTKRSFARNASGEMVGSLSERATCFCSIGALNRASGGVDGGNTRIYRRAFSILSLAAEVPNGLDVAEFNDTHTHAEVMAVWDKAIEQAKLLEE